MTTLVSLRQHLRSASLVAPMAAVFLSLAFVACGDGGSTAAEPGGASADEAGVGGGAESSAESSAGPSAGPSAGASAGAAAQAGGTGRMATIPAGTVEIQGKSVTVEPFLMDKYEVTNDDFAAFVDATGYRTESEQIGNSVVFFHGRLKQGLHPFDVVDGAYWKHPAGSGSDIAGRGDHPVAHVSWNDAQAYANWCGKRLATRAEWIHAASGGVKDAIYPWGNELQPSRDYMMNCWQGTFPIEDKALDGFRGTSPVGSFPPNAFGLHDVAGNVWEWLGERKSVGSGPEDELAEKRGGSFLCREDAAEAQGFHRCKGYQLDRFEWSPIINGNDNVGFRCVKSLPAPAK
ncbi:MAG: sulfatase modifying factor 1 [Planctomycetota bacterium]|jgi:sulfatase modifying factor 1